MKILTVFLLLLPFLQLALGEGVQEVDHHNEVEGENDDLSELEDAQSPLDSAPPDKRKYISKSQFCVGCKETVDLFTTLTIERMIDLRDPRKAAARQEATNKDVDEFCTSKFFEHRHEYVKVACKLLFGNYQKEILEMFSNSKNLHGKEHQGRKIKVENIFFFAICLII